MRQKMQGLWSWDRSLQPFIMACCTTLIAYGLPAHGQQAPSDIRSAVDHSSHGIDLAGGAPGRSSEFAASVQCALVQHWDPNMRMCMPNGEKANPSDTRVLTSPHTAPIAPDPVPTENPPGPSSKKFDRSMDSSMNMSTTGETTPKTMLMFHLNQFMVYSSTSGPRGKSRLTGPGYWMLTYDNDLTPKNHLTVSVMGSPEQLTVGDKGTPQLFQTDHIDNFHAHDTIMAFEFRDVVALSAGNRQRLTFLFAPRGEAAIGPVPFMHRESAEGNPDAPLGHALQDGFHDISTVVGIGYQIARTTVEFTAFSGQNITWPFPLHNPDSYSFRLNQDIDDHVRVGASYANALLPDDTGGAEHNQIIAAWLTTSHRIHGNTLKSAFVWGSARAGHGAFLNSFLEEAVYQWRKNSFYGRAEILQISPIQLGLVTANGSDEAMWVKAFTFGYERTLFGKNDLNLVVGGSYTNDWAPAAYTPAYGTDLRGGKIYLRLKFMRYGRGL